MNAPPRTRVPCRNFVFHRLLVRLRWLKEPPPEVALSMHRSAHDDVVAPHLVEQDVFLKRANDKKEAPFTQPGHV